MRLSGRRALVTGSSQGIGAEIAKLFAKEGAQVVVNHRPSEEEDEPVLRTIRRAGGKGIAVHCDVSDPSSVARRRWTRSASGSKRTGSRRPRWTLRDPARKTLLTLACAAGFFSPLV